MKNKKAQVTIFIILAIVIIGAIILYFTLGDKVKSTNSPETDNINSFVEECIRGTGRDAIYQISQNGGYYLPTRFSTFQGYPYYYHDGKNYMPSKETIEDELALYMNNNLDYCTADFVDFPQFNITSRETTSEITISDEEIILNIKYPLSIFKDEKTYLLENFKDIKIPVRLNIIYDSIEELIKEQLSHKNICLSCITNTALKNNLTIDMVGLEEATLFTIQDDNSKINGIPLKWQFANKY